MNNKLIFINNVPYLRNWRNKLYKQAWHNRSESTSTAEALKYNNFPIKNVLGQSWKGFEICDRFLFFFEKFNFFWKHFVNTNYNTNY